MSIAVGGVWASERLWRRLTGRAPTPPDSASAIDYRLVALGALIPDAIDKPLWRITGHDIGSDHSIGHTLLVLIAIIGLGARVARRGEWRILALGLGCLSHPLVDPVIAYPSTLFWPAFGFRFKPSTGIPSFPYLIGFDLLLIATGVIALRRNERLHDWAKRFVSTGAVAEPD